MTVTDSRQVQLMHWLNQIDDDNNDNLDDALKGVQCNELTMVSGDASFRRYFRFQHQGQNFIAVDAPPAHEDAGHFVAVAKSYLDHGVPVPKVCALDVEQGFYCQQDLGDVLLSDRIDQQNCAPLYARALAILPAIQQCTATDSGPLPLFDQALLDREYHLFTHWLLEVHLGLTVTEAEQSMLAQVFQQLTDNFIEQPAVGVHRDYHSRNLMLDEQQQIGVIDFQDAVIGPVTYDAVSLLRDCYQQWPDDTVYDCLQQHWQAAYQQYPWAQFKRWFDLTGMQRHIKASGIFARLCHRDGKTSYLADIPNTLVHLINAAQRYPQFAEFARFVENRVLPQVIAKNQGPAA